MDRPQSTTKNLYRQEALDAMRHKQDGRVLLLPSQRSLTISIVLAVWLILIMALLVQHSFTEKTTVLGYLSADESALNISAKEPAGIVKHVYIKNGQYVESGQVLFEITRASYLLKGNTLSEHQKYAQKNHERLLEQDHADKQDELVTQSRFLQRQIQMSQTQAQSLSQQSQILHTQLTMAQTQLGKINTLHEAGHASDVHLQEAKLAVLNHQQNLSSIDIQASENALVSSQLAARYAQIKQEIKQAANHYEKERLAQREQALSLESAQSYLIKAPREGIVSNVQVQAGDDLSHHPVLMKLRSVQSDLEVVLAIPSSAAGFIEKSQEVKVRLDAFPHQKYGSLQARLSEVNTILTLPNENRQTAIPIHQAVYLVRAELSRQSILAKGQEIALKDGMTVQADVILSERSLLEWLLAPLYNLRGAI